MGEGRLGVILGDGARLRLEECEEVQGKERSVCCRQSRTQKTVFYVIVRFQRQMALESRRFNKFSRFGLSHQSTIQSSL